MPAASQARLDAMAAGLKTYNTGKPCVRGHSADRFVSNHSCMACNIIRNNIFNERHPGRLNEIARNSSKKKYPIRRSALLVKNLAWRGRNKEKYAAMLSAHRLLHRDEAKERTRLWQKANPEKVREQSNRHRVRKLNAEGTHTVSDVRNIRTKQKDKCAFCRVKLLGKGHLDHIHPLSKGGSDWPRNLQLLCGPCNVSKRATDQIEWARSKGRLL